MSNILSKKEERARIVRESITMTSNALIADFIGKCSYNESDARVAAKNVLIEELLKKT